MKRKFLTIVSATAITAPLIFASPGQAGGVSPGAAVGIGVGSALLGGAIGSALAAPRPAYAYPPPVYYAPPPRCWRESVATYDVYGEFAGYVPRRVCQ